MNHKPVSDALEAWRQAVRELEARRTPRTAEWLQALMVEQERRADYQAVTRRLGLEPSLAKDEPLFSASDQAPESVGSRITDDPAGSAPGEQPVSSVPSRRRRRP